MLRCSASVLRLFRSFISLENSMLVNYVLASMEILNGFGLFVLASIPRVSGAGCPGLNWNRNCCIIEVKYRNSSILASPSPKNILLPAIK